MGTGVRVGRLKLRVVCRVRTRGKAYFWGASLCASGTGRRWR